MNTSARGGLDSRAYEIVVGSGGLAAVAVEFPDCRVEVSRDQTILRCETNDQATLFQILDRVFDFGLGLLAMRRFEVTDRVSADDVDDRVVNHIFGCGLTLAALVGHPGVDARVAERLRDVIDELDDAVAEIRQAAFARARAKVVDMRIEKPARARRSLTMRNPAAEVRVVHADGRRYLCRFAANEAFAYALRGHDFYRASDHVLWARERDGLLLSARTGAPFARRDGDVFFDIESQQPLYFEDRHAEAPSPFRSTATAAPARVVETADRIAR